MEDSKYEKIWPQTFSELLTLFYLKLLFIKTIILGQSLNGFPNSTKNMTARHKGEKNKRSSARKFEVLPQN